MSITFDKGSLFYGNFPLGSGNLYVDDIPMSPYEEQEVSFLLCPYKSAECEFTVNAIDLELLNNMSHIPTSDKFNLTYHKPIMIQARWHKNHRTRKKWLKRYGMKPDTVEVSCQAHSVDYDIDGSFDINADSMEYKWKPHQKRRGLKVEI